MNRAVLLSLMLVGCGVERPDTPDDGPLMTEREIGFVAAPPEPAFNGGFDARDMGRCYTGSDGATLCDWPVSTPTGWAIQPPNVWNHGVHALYANGRTPSAPHPNHPTLSSNSALSVSPCDQGFYGPNFGDCSTPYVLRSEAFPIVAGARYRLAAWFRSATWYEDFKTHENAGGVRVRWLDTAGGVLRVDGFGFSPALVPVKDWTENGALFAAPVGSAQAQVEVTAEKRKRFLYVDDVRLIPE